MEWQPIETMPRYSDGVAKVRHGVVVAWKVKMPDEGEWWERDTDEFVEYATHWMPLPPPPKDTP